MLALVEHSDLGKAAVREQVLIMLRSLETKVMSDLFLYEISLV